MRNARCKSHFHPQHVMSMAYVRVELIADLDPYSGLTANTAGTVGGFGSHRKAWKNNVSRPCDVYLE